MKFIVEALIKIVGDQKLYQILQAANNRARNHPLGRRNRLAAKLAKVEDQIARSRELDAELSASLKAL